MSAQFSQAAGSLLISVLAVRQLPVEEFATLSVLLAGVVLVTGLTTGLVGDSLTVLDRRDPAVRTALRRLLLAVMALCLVVGGGAVVGDRSVGPGGAAAFGVLLALWIGEDTLRRLLMANLRFWPIVAVDVTHLAVSSGVALGYPAVSGSPASLALYLVALSAGQVCAAAVALAWLPREDRRWGAAVPGGVRTVLSFGTSRSVQASLRPLVLLLLRLLVIAAAGKIAFGRLEAARLYAAPALLVVNGFGSFLLSTFAAHRERPRREAVRRADLSVALLTVMTAVLTALGVGLCLRRPDLLSRDVPVAPEAVLAWGVFTGAVAVSMPYGSLVSVAGGQRRVLAVRTLDSVLSLAVLLVVLRTGALGPAWTPAALAVGPVVGALLLRPLALRGPGSSGRRSPARVGDGGSRVAPPG